jgi:hypothetical protein
MSMVSLVDTRLNKFLFSGLITDPAITSLQVNRYEWQCTAKDWSYLLDRAVVKGDYVSSTADYVINDLMTQMPGFISKAGGAGSAVTSGAITSNNVQQGPMLQRILLNWLTMADALNNVTKKCGGQYFGWYVDENRDLHWFNQTQIAPSAPIFSDGASGANVYRYNADNLRYEWDGKDIRNRVYVRGGRTNQSNTRTDNFQVANAASAFPLFYPVHTASPGFSLTVGGAAQTVSVDSGNSSPTTQWVVSKAIPGYAATVGLWWLRLGTASQPSNGTNISLTYNYITPVISQADDGTSQAALNSLPNKGIFASIVNDNAVVDSITAQQRGQRDLKEYANPLEVVTFTTEPSDFTDHVKAGDVIRFTSAVIPDSKNSYAIGSLSAYYLITKNTIKGHPEGMYRTYTIEARRVS